MQLGSVRQRQRHNPLAYIMYIYSILSLQRFQIRLASAVLFPEGDFVAVFWSIFFAIKAKWDQISYFFRLMYCVNDFLTDFIRRLKSSDREDGNENSIFMCPLGLLEQNFTVVARTHNIGASGDRAPVRQQP